MNLDDALRRGSKDWAPETRSAMLAHLRAAAAREELQSRYSSAAELAQAVDRVGPERARGNPTLD